MTWRELLQADAERRAEEYRDQDFKNNPDGYKVAPYVNEETLAWAFESGAQLPNERLLKLIEVLEYNKQQWETISHRDNYKHLAVWQNTRDALENLRKELKK